jgi:hypothetical protein
MEEIPRKFLDDFPMKASNFSEISPSCIPMNPHQVGNFRCYS